MVPKQNSRVEKKRLQPLDDGIFSIACTFEAPAAFSCERNFCVGTLAVSAFGNDLLPTLSHIQKPSPFSVTKLDLFARKDGNEGKCQN